jgi:small basic protein
MGNGRVIVNTGIIGALTGMVIAEFFPRLFQTGIAVAVGTTLNDVFSSYRNELALKYGLAGLAAGLILGAVISAFSGKK